MSHRLFLVVIGFALTTNTPAMAQDRSCSAFTSSPAASIAFLEEQVDVRQSPCITTVIRQLGRAHSSDAVPVLIRYLDFVDPATFPKPDGFADRRPEYPSIEALFLTGKVATTSLLSAIQNSESPVIRGNAAKVYEAVYRDELALGIHILRVSEMGTSAEPQNRLREVSETLAQDCTHRTEDEARMCKKAADGK